MLAARGCTWTAGRGVIRLQPSLQARPTAPAAHVRIAPRTVIIAKGAAGNPPWALRQRGPKKGQEMFYELEGTGTCQPAFPTQLPRRSKRNAAPVVSPRNNHPRAGDKVLVGREGADSDCNVELPDGTVSGRHCEISLGAQPCELSARHGCTRLLPALRALPATLPVCV